jgi:hypothetical protein
MLWNSIADSVVKEMYDEAVAKAAVDRKNDTIKRLSYYHDEQEEYIKDALTLHYADPDAFSPAFFNVVKKIVNQLAMIYLADAEREVDGTERDKAIFKEIVESTSLNPKMKTCSRYTQLLKTTMLRPVWRKGKMDLDVLTGDILDVIISDTPEQLEQVLITHYPQSGETKDITYSLWSDETFRKLDYNGNTLETMPNPYKVIPMVPVWDSYPVGTSFWLAGGDDLINIQSAVNEKLTDLLLVIRQQGFGQAVIKGVPEQGSNMQVGPGTTIEIPDPAGDFFYAKTNAPIQSILNAIDFMVKQLAVSNGLPASSLSVKPTQESGLARISGNRELEELRRDQISLFNSYEKRLFNMFRIVWNVHNPGRKITETARLKVDFYDPKPTLSPDKEVEKWEKELEMGTISRVDILMIKNPDLSREDAQQKLEEIRLENETFKPSPPQA